MLGTLDDLSEKVLARNARAIGRALTIVEDRTPTGKELLQRLYPHTGKAHIVGFTGPPGAGKSTLVDASLFHLRSQGLRVAVIAVDPSSPVTGGAILGDRIRMLTHATDPDVFIRSAGSRGQAGGLSRATREMARILDAAGFDIIIIETAGVGQTEIAIARLADTTTLIIHPEGGDEIQAIKAGIIEVSDVFTIHKCDLPGANRAKRDLEAGLRTAMSEGWEKPLLMTKCHPRPEGVEALWAAITGHRRYQQESGGWELRRQAHLRREIRELIHDFAASKIDHWIDSHGILAIASQEDPHSIAEDMTEQLFSNWNVKISQMDQSERIP